MPWFDFPPLRQFVQRQPIRRVAVTLFVDVKINGAPGENFLAAACEGWVISELIPSATRERFSEPRGHHG
jgi:hypothetical protein